MRRLIDADALLYRLADYQLQASPGWGANGCGNADAYEAITNCMKAIEDAPTVEPGETDWISCNKMMPKEREWIGTKKFGTTISDDVYVTFETPDGLRFTDHICFQNGDLSPMGRKLIDTVYKGAKPIAWMPLPDPYEGE